MAMTTMESQLHTAADGTPAPYGRACTNCARAKCRCIYRSGGADCERCHRLNKECVPSVSIRKRNGKRTHVSRAAQLEAKLEDLVSLLRHQSGSNDKAPSSGDGAVTLSASTPALSTHSAMSQHEDGSSPSTGITVLPPQQSDCGLPSKDRRPVAPGTLLGYVFEPPDASPVAAPAVQVPPAEISCASFISHPNIFGSAAENLLTFRKYMLIFLPFVHLPATMTSEYIRETYPFLWQNIMAVTCQNADRRLAMSEEIRKSLGQKMLMDQEKSLDLLLGLLVIMGWTHYHLKREKPILSLLASMAKSLVFDLGLNKVPGESHLAACLKYPFLPAPKEPTLEERRAVLACFLLTSQISYAIKRLDALTWTSHMDESLETLAQQREWEGDDLLVAQVKVQLIVEQLNRAASQSPDGVPPGYLLATLQSRLQNIKAQLPHHLQQNDTILSHISYAELTIQDAAMTKSKASSNGFMAEIQRHEAMEASLSASKEWLERHFSIPSYVYIGMTFSYWWNMSHCLLTIYRLTVLDDPAWDRRFVRSRCDVLLICDQLRVGFEEVASKRRLATGPTTEDDTFARFVVMMRLMKHNWAPDIAAAEGNPGPSSTVPPGPPGPFINESDGLNIPFYQEDPEHWIAGFFDMN